MRMEGDLTIRHYDLVVKEVLVDVRLHGMTEEYRNFVKNLFFHSFCMLMEATKRKNESLKDLKV